MDFRDYIAVINTPTYGGPHNQIRRLQGRLLQSGWRSLVVLPMEEGDGAKRLQRDGIDVTQIPLHRPRATLRLATHAAFLLGFWSEVGAVRQIIRHQGVALVQVCGLMNLQGALAAKLEKTPLVWQLLSTFAPPTVRLMLAPLVRLLSDVVMTTGKQVAKGHPGLAGMGDRLFLFFPPVDGEEFRPDAGRRSEARRQLGVSENDFLIGTLGNFNRQKAHDVFVDAAAQVASQHPEIRFRVLGSRTLSQTDYYQLKVIDKARQMGLLSDNRLQFISPESEPQNLLPALDLFWLTSRAEGIPTVILEAMSCGIPVVATDVGSIREIVEDGETGLVVPSGGVHEIVGATIRLVESPERRASMADEARRKVLESYDISVCVRAHEDAFARALS